MKATSPMTLLRAAVGLALVSLRACAAVTLVSPSLRWLAAAREPHPMPLKAALVDLAAKTRGGARATSNAARGRVTFGVAFSWLYANSNSNS